MKAEEATTTTVSNYSNSTDHLTTALDYSPQYSYVFTFEDTFTCDSIHGWFADNWEISYIWIFAYLVMVFGGQALMSKRDPYKLRGPLVLWNICLAIFSVWGTIRFMTETTHVVTHQGWHSTICHRNYAVDSQVTCFWTWMFGLSKVVELGDTLFIVLRRQNLIFLHYYHHITVLLFTWFACKERTSLGRWFILMNFFVHSFMYTYYAIRALGYRLPKRLAMIITSLQIAQMIVGCYVIFYGYFTKKMGHACYISDELTWFAFLIYGSYFILFANFFIRSYLRNKLKTN